MAAPGYQSPYYVPTAGAPQMPVHRTPWVLIITAVVVLVVVMAGCGTALAIIGARSGNQNSGAGILPSPSPGGTPSPIASPTGGQSGASASNAGETIPVPKGWAVANKDSESITLVNPDGTGSLTVGSGPSVPAQSAQQNKDTLDKYLQGKYPDVKNCPNSKTTTGSLSGVEGIFWTLCFTLTSGAQSFPASAPLFVGANGSGSVYYLVILLTPAENLTAFVNQTRPILQGIQWKLK
jgi:hypothetical protein